MAETSGILCQGRNPVNTKDGTMCAAQSPKPGITGDRNLVDSALDNLFWAASELSSGTQWVGHELWAEAKWAGSGIWSTAEWAGIEINASLKWSWGEIHDGAVWLGNKAYDACKYLKTLFHKILHAPNWDILKAIAEPILGPFFQQAGILWGVIESLGKDVMSLLELGKMLVLAGCYELMIHPQVATALTLNPTTMPMVLTALALKAVAHEIPDLATEMKKSDDQLKKMVTDIWHMVSNWGEFLGFVKAMGQHIKQEAVNDFNKLKSCAEHRSLTNDFEAGRILGRALYQIVMLILIVLSGVGAVRSALRFLARVPALLRAAKILRYGGEVEELIETEKVIQGAKEAEEVAEKVAEAQKAPKKRTGPKGAATTDPIKLAQAIRDAPSGSAERAKLIDQFATMSTHVKEPANRVVLGKWAEGGGYIQEAQANGGIWYETPEGTYQILGKDAAWETNQAFLTQEMEAGVPKLEFTGMSEDDLAATLADIESKGQPLDAVPARVKEFLFLQDNAGNYGYIQQGMSFVKVP
jgi:hypothetical protein